MLKKISLLVCLMVCVTGCADRPKPQGKPLPDISFEHLQPLSFAGLIGLKNNYVATQGDVGAEFIIPLPVLLERYALSRFTSVKNMPQNQYADIETIFLIERAALTKVDDGSIFNGREIYTADIKLSLSPDGYSPLRKFYSIALSKKLSIPHRYTLARKEMKQMQFLESLIKEIDEQIQIIADKNGY